MNKLYTQSSNATIWYSRLSAFWIFLLCALCWCGTADAQVTFWTDNFDTTDPSTGDRDAPNHADRDNGSGPDICGASDYFFRTDLASDGTDGLDRIFTGFTNFYWRGEI